MTSRRRFLVSVPLVPILPLTGVAARAHAAPALLDPKDPQALGLGYVADAAQVDRAKFAKYAPGQACVNCVLYQGAAGSADAPCPIYAGRRVPAKAWCNAYVKRP